jgi:predicted MFS family arabinose efflux permease
VTLSNVNRPEPGKNRWPGGVVLQRTFGAYFVGNLSSNCGTWIQNIAVALLVYRLTHSTLLVGVANFAQFVGVLGLAPWAGQAADRFDRRRLLLATQAAAFVVSATLALVAAAGYANLPAVMIAALLLGCANGFATPAMQALVPALVSRDDLPSAVAMNTVTFTLARALGPVVGALLVRTAGFATAFGLNSMTYLVLISALLVIRPAEVQRGSGRPALRDSWRSVRSDAVAALMLAVVASVAISGDPVNTLSPAFATTIYHASDTFAGVLIGAFGAGSVLAALTLSQRGGTRRTVIPMVVMSLATAVFALSPGAAVGLGALAVAGFCFLAAQTAATVVLQLKASDAERGRVMALWGVAWLGTRPLASLSDGAAARVIGLRGAALLMALPVLAGAALLLRRSVTSPPAPPTGPAPSASEANPPG